MLWLFMTISGMMAALQIDQKNLVNCMYLCSTKNNFSWPIRHDKCNIPFNNVLCSVPAPIPLGSSGRSYSIQDETI